MYYVKFNTLNDKITFSFDDEYFADRAQAEKELRDLAYTHYRIGKLHKSDTCVRVYHDQEHMITIGRES